jgi:ADP-heptose:LPS heptosyltransferase
LTKNRVREKRLYTKLRRILFDGTSRLTGHFPKEGSHILELSLRPLAGHPLLSALFAHRNRRVVRGLRSFLRFLVVPDIHIGDAVMSQAALTALRDFFPDAQVDYIVNKTAYPLIEGNPEATRVVPFFSGGSFPSAENLLSLRTMIRDGGYDLVLNFCPNIDDKDIGLDRRRLLNFLTYAPTIVRNERRPTEINHFAFLTYGFTRELLSLVAEPWRPEKFGGLRLTVGNRAVEDARRFASEAGLSAGAPVIMFNPDAASPFTRMPLDKQTALLSRIARLDTAVLLGAGQTEAGIGERLLASLPRALRLKVRIVPASLSLESYTALLDLCDVFVTGDTGPLHLAAARKESPSGRHEFRNRTAVMSFFGATPARMSGYDSFQPGYLPANQDAPSWSYTAGSPCRNITCVNKTLKTCRTVRCFDDVDVEGLARLIGAYLRTSAPTDFPVGESVGGR